MKSRENTEIIFGEKSQKIENKLYVRIEDLEIPHGEDYKTALEELKKFETFTINGLQFLELFKYLDISLWWYIYPTILPVYKQLVNFILEFQKLLDEVNPYQVKIESNFEKLSLIKQICKKNDIKLVFSKMAYSKYNIKSTLIENSQKKRFEKITNAKIQTRKNIFSKNNTHMCTLENKILFAIPTIYRRKILNYDSGKSEDGEYIQQTIMNYFEDKSKILGIDIDYTFKGQFEILTQRLSSSMDWLPIELLLTSSKKPEHSEFLKNIKELFDNQKFQDLFKFNGISLWDSLKNSFQKMTYAPNLPLYLNLYDSLLAIFKTEKPKIIFLPYETGPYALCIISAAKHFQIKTIGIAHAFIAKYIPMYSHKSCISIDNLYGHPIPDISLVFGDYSKNILIENGYPEKQIISFGNPAFFNMNKILSSLEHLDLTEKYNLPKNTKVVLFTSGKLQPYYSAHGTYDYDVQTWKELLESFSNNEDYFVILKPHPQEKNIEIYQNLLEKYDARNFLITHESLFELLHISSIVVSIFSTTMIDALCFDKPVIQVKFQNQSHTIPFEEYNAVIGCSLSEITKNIINSLDDDQILNKLSVNRKKFLKDQYGLPENEPKKTILELIT